MKDAILFRSMLFVPGANPKAMAKAPKLDADAIIFDLEDAVGRDVIDDARQAVKDALQVTSQSVRLVRVNAIGTSELRDDLNALRDAPMDAVVLPKVGASTDIDKLADQLGLWSDLPIWVMLETPTGILNAQSIMAHDRVAGMILGSNDLSKELKIQPSADRLALLPAIGMAVLAARAAGKRAIDAVFNDFRNAGAFDRDAKLGRQLGFEGKSLIHPAQIDIANRVFSPSADEVEQARAVVQAFELAQENGHSVAVLDGAMIEELHVAQANETLARHALTAKGSQS